MDQPSSTESNALTLRIRFKSASLEEFIGRYGVDVSPGGIFIRTRKPVEVGTTLQFEFTLADGSGLLAGLGTVAWVRENDPARANSVPGMGLRFDKLTPESQTSHQTILSEKARKEGKPQGTPYPPTAFVAPASRPSPAPESAAAAAPVAPPRPVEVVGAPPLSAASFIQSGASDADEFDSGGKTEISDKPLDYYMREADAAQRAALAAAPLQEEPSAPSAPFEDIKTDAHAIEDVGPPPAPDEVAAIDVQTSVADAPLPQPPLTASGERQMGARQSFASLVDLGDSAQPLEDGNAPFSESLADLSSGVPVAETPSEKTEEVSLLPAKSGDSAAVPLDLGTATPSEEDEQVPSLAQVAAMGRKPRRSGAMIAVGVVLAGAAAFGAVYILQTKPWESSGDAEGPTVVVKKHPAVAPLPTKAPAEPVVQHVAAPKPAAAEEPTAEKPPAKKAAAVEEKKAEKPAVAEEKKAGKAAVAEEKSAEKPAAAPAAEKAAAAAPAAEKPAPGKPAAEKPVAAKPEPEAPAPKPAPKPAPAPAAKAAASAESPAAAEEEIFRLSFKSSPIGAEVLIDGEYFARTPCERRILDPKKSLAITLRREGYEPHERVLGASDNWVKKGNEHILTISVNLKKSSKPAEVAPATAGAEAKPAALKPSPTFDESGKAKE